MKKTNTYFSALIFILSLMVFSACSNNSEQVSETIKVNLSKTIPNHFDVKIDKIIPLQTLDSVLIGRITKVIYFKNYIYVFDMLNSKAITCFSDTGKFKFKINIGKGPNEVVLPTDFSVYNDIIYIKDRNVVKMYGFDNGELVKSIYLNPNLYFDDFLLVDSGKFMTFGNSPSLKAFVNPNVEEKELSNHILQYKLIDSTLQVESQAFIKGDFNFSQIRTHQPMCKYNNHFILLNPPSSDIYEYQNNKLNKKYKIDFGNYSFTDDELKDGIDNYITLISSKRRVGLFDYINETKDFISFSFIRTIGINTFCLFSKKTHNVALFENILYENNLPNMNPLSTVDNKFACVLDPATLNSDEINVFKRKFNLKNEINNLSNSLIIILNIYEKK